MKMVNKPPKHKPLSEIQRTMREQNAITRKMAKRGVPVVHVPKPKRSKP